LVSNHYYLSTKGKARGPRNKALPCITTKVINGFFKKNPFQRSHLLTSCALGILQSHTLRPHALFVSLITKCNMPYKCTKSSLRSCYANLTSFFHSIFFLSRALHNPNPSWMNLDCSSFTFLLKSFIPTKLCSNKKIHFCSLSHFSTSCTNLTLHVLYL